MNYTVLYRKREHVKDSYMVNQNTLDLLHYEKVTEVSIPEVTKTIHETADDIYRRMNYVDGSDEELVGPGKLNCRSMMPGDLIVNQHGYATLVKMSGFELFHIDGWKS